MDNQQRLNPHPRDNRVGMWRAGTLASVVLLVAGCSAAASPSHSSTSAPVSRVGNTLTVGYTIAPNTLDPGKAPQNNAFFEELAYEPLIVAQPDGSLAPGLAASWSYGAGNTTFVMHLRSNVKASDGSMLTAQDVVNDLNYAVSSGAQEAPFLKGDTFTASGPLTVTITAPNPNPDFAILLTQTFVIGDIISPKGLQSRSLLGTQTFGFGPYMLAAGETTTGDTYTYVPNPNYYDKASVHWKKVVIKVITTAQSMLSALETGEIDVGSGSPTTLTAAKSAGLTPIATPALWVGMILADRNGTVSKALGNVQVRQALNYATDRAAITKGLFPPGDGTTSDEPSSPGGYGYDTSVANAYPYNPTMAKQLLASAGYPNGFTLQTVTADYDSMNLVAEALASEWKAIGVTLQITDDANTSAYDSAAFSSKMASFMTVNGTFVPMALEGPSLFLSTALYNPFHVSDPSLTNLYDQEVSASGSAQQAADQQIEDYLVHQAWFVPVTTFDLLYYARSTVTGTTTSAKAPLLDLYDIEPAS
jgi:peptide/nickel transport system substrate-binding protein